MNNELTKQIKEVRSNLDLLLKTHSAMSEGEHASMRAFCARKLRELEAKLEPKTEMKK